MLLLLAIVAAIALFLTNGGWAWLKTLKDRWPQASADIQTNLQPVIDDLRKAGQDASKGIHTLVDNWLALSTIPSITNDPEAIKALEVIRNKIFAQVLQQPATTIVAAPAPAPAAEVKQ